MKLDQGWRPIGQDIGIWIWTRHRALRPWVWRHWMGTADKNQSFAISLGNIAKLDSDRSDPKEYQQQQGWQQIPEGQKKVKDDHTVISICLGDKDWGANLATKVPQLDFWLVSLAVELGSQSKHRSMSKGVKPVEVSKIKEIKWL